VNAIEARGLHKRYGTVVAVDGIDLVMPAGVCLGLLGPNGAGKTTTIEMLEGLLAPDAGEIRILDLSWKTDGRAIRQRIGVQLQETRLLEKLTVREVLETFRCFYERGREPEEVMDLIGLTEKARARTNNLSGGQRQRLALGCALVSYPEILFLDEPTTGLDPQARRRVWEIVEEFRATGGSILLTTHYMEEAERLADDLIIMDHGRIIASGSPREIIASLGAESIVEFTLGQEGREGQPPQGDGGVAGGDADGGETTGALPDLPPDFFAGLPGLISERRANGRVALSLRETHAALPALLQRLQRRRLVLTDLHTHRPTLEDVFVSLTGRHLRDE